MAEPAIAALPATAARNPDRGRSLSSVSRWRLFVYVASMLFSIGWTLALGKDVHWDALNYHLYAGFSVLNDRFALDFFGAGTPAYLNPYAHLPLYLMAHAQWPALWMAIAFAVLHSTVLWLTFEVALVAGLRNAKLASTIVAALAIALTLTNPVLLQGLGSTMTDLSTGAFALGGWLAIAYALRDGKYSAAFVAGTLCGLAAALKLSNAVFAIAAVPTLLLVPGSPMRRARIVAAFVMACGLAFAIVALPWSWQLWREFENPFFPFFNQYFQSPDFVITPIKQERFVPLDWQAFVLRPLQMLAAQSAVHVEPRAPDVRYLSLGLALMAWLGYRLFARKSEVEGADRTSIAASRTLTGLIVGFCVAWIIWLEISGNSRYFLPMACLASVFIALVFQRLYAAWPKASAAFVISTVTLQIVQLIFGSDLVRDGGRWEGPWLRVEVPERLRNTPHLYLSAGFLSGSAFLPYLHPESGLMNIGGFNVIGPNHAGGERAQRLIDSNIDRVRLLLPLPEGVVDRSTLPGPPQSLSIYFRRFGLRVDGSDCEFMHVEGNVRGERRPMRDPWKHFITCRLVSAPEERLAYEKEAAMIDPLFDRVEEACPKLFYPPRPVTQEFHYWARTYHLGSEAQLFIDEGRIKYFFYLRGGDAIDIGSVEDWRKGPQPIDCTLRFKPAFGIPL